MEQWLSSVDTMPDIQFCLLQGLCMEQPSLFSPFASPSTQVATQAQDQISWTNLLLGQLAMDGQVYNTTTCPASLLAALLLLGLLELLPAFWQYLVAWTVEGTACTVELQVAEDLHAQFVLGLQDLPFSESHCIEGHSVDSLLCTPLTDHQCWLAHVALAHQIGQQQCQAGIQGMQAAFQNFLNLLPQSPLRVELHLGFSLFLCFAETGELLLKHRQWPLTQCHLPLGLASRKS